MFKKTIIAIALILFTTISIAATIKISELPTLSTPAGTDIYPTSHSGVTYKVTLDKLKTYINSGMALGVGYQYILFSGPTETHTYVLPDADSTICTTDSICTGYQVSLGFTPEDIDSKNTNTNLGTSDTDYPSQKAVKTYVDTIAATKQNSLGFTAENISNKSTDTALGSSDTLYPSQKAVRDYVLAHSGGGSGSYQYLLITGLTDTRTVTFPDKDFTVGEAFDTAIFLDDGPFISHATNTAINFAFDLSALSEGTYTQTVGATGFLNDPGANGVVKRTSQGTSAASTYSDIIALFGGGSCSGYPKSDGTCDTPAGGEGTYTLTTSIISSKTTLTTSDLDGAHPKVVTGSSIVIGLPTLAANMKGDLFSATSGTYRVFPASPSDILHLGSTTLDAGDSAVVSGDAKNLNIIGTAAHTAYLSGSATISDGGHGVLASNPTSTNFGTLSSAATQTFTISNTGDLTAGLFNDISTSMTGTMFSVNNGCGTTLGTSATCDIGVTYTPIAGVTSSSTLTVAYDNTSLAIATQGTGTSAGGGGGSWSCNDANLLCESFDTNANGNYDLSGWTEVTTGGTINANASHSGTFACTDKGSEALDITKSATSAAYIRYNLGSGQTTLYQQRYFNVVSKGTMGSFLANALFVADPDTDPTSVSAYRVYFYSGSTNHLQLYYYNGTTNAEITGTSAINVGTWYRVGVYANGSTGVIEMYVNGTLDASAADYNPTGRLPQYIYIGQTETVTGTDTLHYQFDNVKSSTSAMPGACPQ